jgi:hypothetical protein
MAMGSSLASVPRQSDMLMSCPPGLLLSVMKEEYVYLSEVRPFFFLLIWASCILPASGGVWRAEVCAMLKKITIQKGTYPKKFKRKWRQNMSFYTYCTKL